MFITAAFALILALALALAVSVFVAVVVAMVVAFVVVVVVIILLLLLYCCLIQFKVTMDMLHIREPDPSNPPLTGWGTVLPTHICLSPPGHYANKASRATGSPVCTHPACPSN